MNNSQNNRHPDRNNQYRRPEVGHPGTNGARPQYSGRPMPGGQTPNNAGPSRPAAQTPVPGMQARQGYQQVAGVTSHKSQYPPVRHVSRKQARKKKIALAVTGLLGLILVLLLISVVIFAARCTVNLIGDHGQTETDFTEYIDTTDVTSVTDPAVIPETDPPETEPETESNYDYIDKNAADIHKGYQILINYEYPYDFGDSFNFKTLYSAKNGLYKVSNSTDSIDSRALDAFVSMMSAFGDATGNRDIIITSADRTYEFQEELYNDRVDMYGEDYARLYVAAPGHSEHHTGLALDLAIYTDGGRGYTFDDKPEYGDWMRSNAHKFGYIERYQASKTPITKIAYENWHYRYIGKPHAYYIKSNDLCLEEYVDLLRDYRADNPLSFFDDEGIAWEIYFVPAESEETIIRVPIPKYFEYEISGNNADGFIVTVKKQ